MIESQNAHRTNLNAYAAADTLIAVDDDAGFDALSDQTGRNVRGEAHDSSSPPPTDSDSKWGNKMYGGTSFV